MTHAPPTPLDYARPPDGPRPWCRSAVGALAWVLAHPLVVAGPLVYAADNNLLPQHFLCCSYPGVSAVALVGTPLVGVALGGYALFRIARDRRRPRPRGAVVATIAAGAGCAMAAFGGLILMVAKA